MSEIKWCRHCGQFQATLEWPGSGVIHCANCGKLIIDTKTARDEDLRELIEEKH